MIQNTRQPVIRSQRGFSLIELMAVIIIIGVLGSIVMMSMSGSIQKGKIAATKTSMATVKNALKIYHGSFSVYPDSNSVGIQVLIQERFIDAMPKDGWGRDIEYYSPTQEYPAGFELLSAGPDLVSGTEDDIRVTPDSP